MSRQSPALHTLSAALLAAFACTAQAQPQHLFDPAVESYSQTISGDGRVVAAYEYGRGQVLLHGASWADQTVFPSDSIFALSHNGAVAAGEYSAPGGYNQATVWHGNRWSASVNLGERFGHPLNSSVWALNHNGDIAAGLQNIAGSDHAVIWHGHQWDQETDLGVGRVHALNGSGNIAAGWSSASQATIWHGNNWHQKTELGSGMVRALNHSGQIAAGRDDSSEATIWHGDNWQNRTAVGTLRPDNSGYSDVQALSADGRIAAGEAANIDGHLQAVVWRGDNWQEKIPLPGLAPGRDSVVQALSADGQIAVGSARNANNLARAVVWRLAMPRAVDSAHTQATLAQLGNTSSALLAGQRHSLQRASQGCHADGGRFCTAWQYAHSDHGPANSHTASISAGYGFSPRLSAGLSLDYDFLPRHHRNRHPNPTLGLYSRWQHENGWFAHFGAAYGHHKVSISRPQLPGTEAGHGNSRIKGAAWELAGGFGFTSAGGSRLQPYVALRHQHIRRDAYSENSDIAFPAHYGELKLRDTALALGLNAEVPLSGKWSWHSALEVEQRLDGNTPRYRAEANPIVTLTQDVPVRHTRIYLHSGVQYAINPALKLSITPHVGRNIIGHTQKGAALRLEGRF